MTAPPRVPALTALETAVLETVIYSDVFDFAVTAEEVWRWLPVPASREEVTATLASGQIRRLLASSPPYFTLQGRDRLVARRASRAQSSAWLRQQAAVYGNWIARLPGVRLVAITGSLAYESAEAGDDIDYLIVTAPGRLWLTRALTMLVVRLAALRHVSLCPNYFLAESALELPNRDYYTARELYQMLPLSGADIHRRLLATNAWWRQHLPNAAAPPAAPAAATPSLLRRAVERALAMGWAGALERALQRRKVRELSSQAGANDEAVFSDSVCKGHFEAYGRRTRDALAERWLSLRATEP